MSEGGCEERVSGIPLGMLKESSFNNSLFHSWTLFFFMLTEVQISKIKPMRRTSIPPAQNSICLTLRTALTKLCFYHLEHKQHDYGNGNKLESLESFTYRKGILLLELQHNFIVHTTARFHAAFQTFQEENVQKNDLSM